MTKYRVEAEVELEAEGGSVLISTMKMVVEARGAPEVYTLLLEKVARDKLRLVSHRIFLATASDGPADVAYSIPAPRTYKTYIEDDYEDYDMHLYGHWGGSAGYHQKYTPLKPPELSSTFKESMYLQKGPYTYNEVPVTEFCSKAVESKG